MDERLSRLEARVDDLARRLERVERLASEGLSGTNGPLTDARAPGIDASVPSLTHLPILLGRSCLVLAGAYLLRALTAGAVWPRALGIGAGVAYAALWLLLAHRSALKGLRASAAFHAWCAALIVFPLLWEGRVTLSALSDAPTAMLWMGFSLAGLAVAQRHHCAVISSSTAVFGFVIGAALLFRTSGAGLIFAALLLVALAGVAVPRRTGAVLAWAPVVVLDAVVLLFSLAATSLRAPSWLAPERVLIGQAVFVSVFVLLFNWHLRRTKSIGAMDVVQLAFASVVGVLALLLPWPQTGMRRGLAWGVVMLGGALWFLAAANVPSIGKRLLQCTAVGLVFCGTAVALNGPARLLVWGGLTLVAAALGRQQPALAWVAASFGGAAAWESGLLPSAWTGFTEQRPSMPLLGETVLGSSFGLLAFRASQARSVILPRMGLLALAALGALMLTLTARQMAISSGVLAEAFVLLSPPVIAMGLAMLLLLLHRFRVPEARAVGLTGTLAAGFAIVAQDLLLGSLTQRFVGLTTLGAALIAATLLLRASARERSQSNSTGRRRPAPTGA